MNDEPSLNRPLLATRTRRTVLSVGAALATMFAAGIGVGVTLHNAPRVEHISVRAPKVTVTVPPAPPPQIALTVPPPAAPTPPPAPEPVPNERPPRPVTPTLWPHCVLVPAGYAEGSCAWDDGFPAISADGTLIASKLIPDDGGRGNPGLEIHFLDAATGKKVRTIVVMSPDEYMVDDGTNSDEVAKLQKRIYARVAEVQRTLDVGSYRAMVHLGTGVPEGHESPDPRPTPTTTYADIDGGGVARVVDPATNAVIWQHAFGVGSPHRRNLDDGLDSCGGWGLWSMELWWDPTTRVALANEWYRTGGCMCPDVPVDEVTRVPEPTR